jgi:hypothetical protein
MELFRREILQTLLYYDIWAFPLTLEELFTFMPVRVKQSGLLEDHLERLTERGDVGTSRGYFFVPQSGTNVVDVRLRRQSHARRMWLIARAATHVIKRCPFVRAVFVSGDLSKNVTDRASDIDFFIVTAPSRLWIARTLLILFKKVALLNRKKFFCLNSFISSDHLVIDDHNIYQASEVAQLKPLFQTGMYEQFLQSNTWIRDFFPNFSPDSLQRPCTNNRRSFLQALFEIPLGFLPLDAGTPNSTRQHGLGSSGARRANPARTSGTTRIEFSWSMKPSSGSTEYWIESPLASVERPGCRHPHRRPH